MEAGYIWAMEEKPKGQLHTGRILKRDGSFVLFEGFKTLKKGNEVMFDRWSGEVWCIDSNPFVDNINPGADGYVLAIMAHKKQEESGTTCQ